MNADKLLSEDETLLSEDETLLSEDDNDELGGLEYEQQRIGRTMAQAMRCLGWALHHKNRDLARKLMVKIGSLSEQLYAAENPPTPAEAAAENRRRAAARDEKQRREKARADAEAEDVQAAAVQAGGLH